MLGLDAQKYTLGLFQFADRQSEVYQILPSQMSRLRSWN